MSVLGRRLAGAEGAYFLRESKNAAGRLAAGQQKKAAADNKGGLMSVPSAAGDAVGKEHPLAAESADVLPEVLRHSVPLRCQDEMSPSSFSGGSKWNLGNGPASSPRLDGVINPLRDYVSIPQATFGPKRWQLPDAQISVSASTANELRRDRYPEPINPEKLKAAAAGLSHIGKAFAIATAIIFGGATSIFAFTAFKLKIQNPARGRLLHRSWPDCGVQPLEASCWRPAYSVGGNKKFQPLLFVRIRNVLVGRRHARAGRRSLPPPYIRWWSTQAKRGTLEEAKTKRAKEKKLQGSL